MQPKKVIYTRYSTEMQSPKSCSDQEREIREALSRMGIDHASAVVIHDQAETGTATYRDEFQRLETMLVAKEIKLLAVDDQARLTRADNAFAFITDVVFSGGRFISTGEGIDTTQPGWELRVKVMELHNSTTIRELGRRVRRGQLGRVLSNLRAGDLCYGYESYYVNPEQAESDRRGPKPEKGIRINEEEARWVRFIFDKFTKGWSISAIARELTNLGATPGRRRKKPQWTAKHVRSILGNPKYIGIWGWGATTTIRDSKGRKKQVPMPKEQLAVTERPGLRIVDQGVWKKARKLLDQLNEIYGRREGQKKRGPKVHHTEVYPASLLGGLLFCGECEARLWYERSGPRVYFGCPNRGDGEHTCSMTTWVPRDRAEDAILDLVAKILKSCPEWVERALAAMRTAITEVANRVPEQLAADRRRLADLEHQIDNLVDLLAGGNIQSSAVATRPSGAEAEAERIRERIEEAERLLTLPAEMPDDAWIAKQLGDMHAVLRDDERQTATLLRKLIGQVEAHQVLPPGKTRGYAQLRFKINGWEVIRSLLEGRLRDGSFELLIPDPTSAEGISPEFRIDLGGPTLMDQWAPKIAKMRAQRMKWTEIVEITGLDLNRAYCAWKRYVDAQQREHDADSRQKPLRDLDGEPGVAPEDIPEETSEGREDAA